ncbi:hypothetical protein LTR86_011260 [Recurvomyces mirabilis]|nr:hypothetical protein LTR86_011260 [Recurvomyces mirabilis]
MSSDIQRQKDLHSRGFARIWIRHLRFETEQDTERHTLRPGQDDGGRLEELLRNFREDDCHRNDRMHVLPVVVDHETLHRALDRGSDPGRSALPRLVHDAPLLTLSDDAMLTCLDGRLRVRAAQEFFPICDQWWTVEVYDDALPAYVRTAITHETPVLSICSDGDVFLSYHCLLADGDSANARKSLAHLTLRKKKNLLQIQRYHDGKLSDALRPLFPFRALLSRRQFRLGSYNRVLPMHCPEEISSGPRSVHHTWSYVLGTDVAPERLDGRTVALLELQMPKYSTVDADNIRAWMLDHTLFPDVVDDGARGRIEARLLTCRRIPTLHSFAEDTILLEICYKVLSDLLPSRWTRRRDTRGHTDHSLREMFKDSFTLDLDLFPTHYLSLWLDVFRHFTDLSHLRSGNVRKDRLRPTPTARAADASEMAQLALRASRRGFQTDAITRWVHRCPDSLDLEAADLQPPRFVSDEVHLPPRDRCGRPREADFLHVRKGLYLNNVLEAPCVSPGRYVTWLAVACEMIFSFFPQDLVACKRYLQEQGTAPLPHMVMSPESASLRRTSSVYTSSRAGRMVWDGEPSDAYGSLPGTDWSIGQSKQYTWLTGPNNNPFASDPPSRAASRRGSVTVDLHNASHVWAEADRVRNHQSLAQSVFLYSAVPFDQLNIDHKGSRVGNILAYMHDRQSDFVQDIHAIKAAICATSLPLHYVCQDDASGRPVQSRIILLEDAWRALIGAATGHGAVIAVNLDHAGVIDASV